MEFIYDTHADIYEPFIIKIDTKEYKLQFPLTTEKMQGFWEICYAEETAVKEGKIETGIPNKALTYMLEIPADVLNLIDHRTKMEYMKELVKYVLDSQKKKEKPLKLSK